LPAGGPSGLRGAARSQGVCTVTGAPVSNWPPSSTPQGGRVGERRRLL